MKFETKQPMSKHVMIDLETLGQKPGCAIFEIGAVVFDPLSGETGEEFFVRISPDNGHVDPGTEEWHRAKGTYPLPGAGASVGISKALADFARWFHGLGAVESVWAWGASFDFPVLDDTWRRWGPTEELPWKYYQAECARTVWRRAFGPEVKRPEREHSALADVKAAVRDLALALAALKGGWPLRDALWAALPVIEDAREDALHKAREAEAACDPELQDNWARVAEGFRLQAEHARWLLGEKGGAGE